uniref:PH domain-containing protein n=1 Tax=Anopheles darlingi TaxID=43151 RepID=A0A2K6VB78_ANODA
MTTARVEMSRDVEKPDGDRTPVAPSPAPATGIQMRGYLKKKRNVSGHTWAWPRLTETDCSILLQRMGGWRKLYVVLQSQLLLSYASRRDYERRLAPFEDIINLVPGTRILPSAGLRFTIETNSRNFYTFRCVDHRNCSEWITALLDSLQQGGCNRGGGGGAIRDRQFGQPSPDHRTSSPVWASLSMELGLARVLHQTMEGEGGTRCAGRSGQRTKPTTRDEEEQQQQQLVPFQRPALQATTPATGRGVAVVPLPKHERHHSDEACADEIITKAFQFLTRPKRSRDMTASEILEYYLERRHRSQQQEQTNDENEKGKQSAVRRAAGVDSSGSSFNTRLETATTSQPLATEDTAATAEQQTRKLQQQEATAPVRFRDFRLHPDADRPITSVGRSQSVDVSRINSISCSDLPPVMRWQLAAGTFVASISGPVVGPGASYTLRRASLERNAATSGYEYISAHSSSSTSSSSTSSNSSSASTFASNRRIELIEPIYAVVDVKAKRFRRNQQQEQQEQEQQEQQQHQQELSQDERTRPNHHYEEAIPVLGPDRPMSEEATEQDDLPYDQQHIYEPVRYCTCPPARTTIISIPVSLLQIMIAAQPPTSTSVASTAATATGCEREHHWRKLWRNLKRIRLHPGRNRRQKEQPAGPNVTVVAVEQPSTDPSATSSTSCSSGSSNGSHQRSGLIAGLGSRLDSHRQSMKKRAKSLYDATSNAA